MHKDRPPGIFDFPHRSVGHGVWLGLAFGVLLSFLVHTSLLIMRADPAGTERPLAGAEAAQRVMAQHKKPPTNPTPVPPPAVNY